jgi:glucose/arabinose dehydrogenase
MVKTFYLNTKSLLVLFLIVSVSSAAQVFPSGFSQVAVGNVYYPTSIASAPDGRIFVTEKGGKVKIVKNGAVLSTPFLQVTVEQTNERGLSSIAIDPDFNNNKYVYIYYTTTSGGVHNRLSRFTASGDLAVSGSEVILKDFPTVVNSIHNGGGIAFGPDGKLYLGMGEDHVPANAPDLTTPKGKVLRMNKDGSAPGDNPFASSSNQWTKLIWSYGLRNPWSLAIQPGTGKIFVGDVGESGWEEINDVTQAGKNFGWPAAEGNSSNASYQNPFYTYAHGSGTSNGCAISGGAFINSSNSNYPSTYNNKYFFLDYCNNWIRYIDASGGSPSVFATALPNALNSMCAGPDGNLYYFSISTNLLYKIVYSGGNPPVITQQPVSQTVPQGQQAGFSVVASGAQPLSYQWKKNNVNISGATASSYSITNAQTTHAGQYKVTVTNSYGSVTSNTVSLTVTAANGVPSSTITAPMNGATYKGGDIISFSGNGSDPEEGILPASRFSWLIEFHHDQHFHPGPTIPPGVKSGTFAIPTTGEASANVYYRIICSVKDAQNQTASSYVDIFPRTSSITLVSNPAGLQLEFDGQPQTTPYTKLAVENMQFPIGASSPQTLGGTTYTFTNWSDGGAANHNLTIPVNNTTYTATYNPGTSGNCSASGNILREHWSNRMETQLSNVPFNSVAPTYSTLLNIFEAPKNITDNYASRIRGFVCPPTTGNYVFWIASDNQSELYISTDANPANKVKRASVSAWTMSKEWTKYPSQQTVPLYLIAGNKYYIEAIHLEVAQGDNLAVGWQLPNGVQERPIPGSRLSSFSQPSGNTLTVSITSPANNAVFNSPSSVVLNASAGGPNNITKVEFYKNSVKLGEDLSYPYSYTWANPPSGNYLITAKATDSGNNTATSQGINIQVSSAATCTAMIQPGGPTTFCSGGNVTLNANQGPGYTYQWKKDNVNISGATGPSYNTSTEGDYQVKIVFPGCTAWSAPIKVDVNTSLKAKITPGGPTTFCNGNSVTLYANVCNGYMYQWKKNGNDIPGETGNTYLAVSSGSYQVKIVQGSSVSWSALSVVTVSNCSNAKTIEVDSSEVDKSLLGQFQVKIYPNPTTGLFTFDFCLEDAPEETLEIHVFSATGQLVHKQPPVRVKGCYKETINLSGDLSAGVYILHLKLGNSVESAKLVLAR